jgi:sortase A
LAAAVAVAAGLVLSACGASSDGAVEDNPIAYITPAPTVAPTTIATTTTAPPTTIATTTTVALPVPVPPPDENAQEPLVEAGRIEIPKLHLDTHMYEGVTLGTLDSGPGHWPGSANPGQIGNVVIAGHRTSHHADFLDIDQLVPGDEVILSNIGGRYTYKVTGTEIITPDQIRIIDQTPARTATLFACHPKHSTRERIVVHLQLAA